MTAQPANKTESGTTWGRIALILSVPIALLAILAFFGSGKPALGNGQAFYELGRQGVMEIADGREYSDYSLLCQAEMRTRVVAVSPLYWSQYENRQACQLEFDRQRHSSGVAVALIAGYRHYLTIRTSSGEVMRMTAVGPGIISGDFRVLDMVVFLDDRHHRLTQYQGFWTRGWLDELDDGSAYTWTEIGSSLLPTVTNPPRTY